MAGEIPPEGPDIPSQPTGGGFVPGAFDKPRLDHPSSDGQKGPQKSFSKSERSYPLALPRRQGRVPFMPGTPHVGMEVNKAQNGKDDGDMDAQEAVSSGGLQGGITPSGEVFRDPVVEEKAESDRARETRASGAPQRDQIDPEAARRITFELVQARDAIIAQAEDKLVKSGRTEFRAGGIFIEHPEGIPTCAVQIEEPNGMGVGIEPVPEGWFINDPDFTHTIRFAGKAGTELAKGTKEQMEAAGRRGLARIDFQVFYLLNGIGDAIKLVQSQTTVDGEHPDIISRSTDGKIVIYKSPMETGDYELIGGYLSKIAQRVDTLEIKKVD